MQKHSTTSLFIRLKYALLDEIGKNLRLYITYFIVLGIGLIVGILWGIKIASTDTLFTINNYLDGFLSGECGLFSLFFDNILTYAIFGVLLIIALKLPIFSWIIIVCLSFFLAKGVRDGVYLFVSCGGSGIVAGLLFYIIFRLLYCIVLSISLIFVILQGKYCYCCTKQIMFKVLILYSFAILSCLVYSLVISIVITIILV